MMATSAASAIFGLSGLAFGQFKTPVDAFDPVASTAAQRAPVDAVFYGVAPSATSSGSQTPSAAGVVWSFDNPLGVVNSPHTYQNTTGVFDVVASGYRTAHSPPAHPNLGQTWGVGGGYAFSTGTISTNKLYGINSNSHGSGLGLLGIAYGHEITAKSFVQLNVSDLILHGLTNLMMTVGSVQANEGFYLWGSNSPGIPGELLKVGANPGSGGSTQSFVVPQYGAYRYFAISADPNTCTSSEVLIRNGLSATVPEPTAILLFGIVGMLCGVRR